MAAALVNYAASCSIEPKPELVEEFLNFPGEGIYGMIEGEHFYIGNYRISLRAESKECEYQFIYSVCLKDMFLFDLSNRLM